jgi:hypothetical protein
MIGESLEDVFALVVPSGSTARTASTDAGAFMSGEVQCSTSPYVLIRLFTKAFCSVVNGCTESASAQRNRRVVLERGLPVASFTCERSERGQGLRTEREAAAQSCRTVSGSSMD